ncbi:FCD domain-containing protein [Telmatospirillum sp.]|uniref:FCD domain-containing protein n=1 Tax=Telmatospirillum sp. TaxID=2079197 RepID=UPI00283CEFC2|nr:FCD domain-containing protein [Telmatospirillum sp.]MDR3438555.1 FCD domain-containing protein [Telmatospirillum sp.]
MLPCDALLMMQSRTLTGLVQEEILRMIREGELEAGAKLSEVSLAQRLNVSRGPVREAFRALEVAGLVRLIKNRGVFVRRIEADEAIELYEIRAGLDEIAGRRLAPIITEAQLAELSDFVTRMDLAAAGPGINDYFPINLKFHDRLIEMAGNARLLSLYRRLIDETYLLRRRSLTEGGGLACSNGEHRAIVAALSSGDGEQAAAAMRCHVHKARGRFLDAAQATDSGTH